RGCSRVCGGGWFAGGWRCGLLEEQESRYKEKQREHVPVTDAEKSGEPEEQGHRQEHREIEPRRGVGQVEVGENGSERNHCGAHIKKRSPDRRLSGPGEEAWVTERMTKPLEGWLRPESRQVGQSQIIDLELHGLFVKTSRLRLD